MPEQRLYQSQQLKQEQILAPQQIQSLELLLAPILELQEKIEQELEQNPVLEQVKASGEELAGDPLTETGANSLKETKEETGEDEQDQELNEFFSLADSWNDYLPPSQSQQVFTGEDDEKRQHFFNSLAEEPSLQEQLMEQLRLSDASQKTRKLAELVIGSIDDQGYLRSHLADLAVAGNANMEEMEKALKFVQAFDPPGIGARSLQECLLLQLDRKGKNKSVIAKLVEHHLDDLAKNRLPQVAKKLRISLTDLYDLINEIKTLNPHPGSTFSKNNPIFVIPEVTIVEKNGKFVVLSNDENLPRLRISKLYRKLLENSNTPQETREYIRSKLNNGKMLIKSIEQRQSTLRRIAEVIVDTQYDFLKEGIDHLKPLTMQQVADRLGLHETTISRAIANKYVQSPVGLFEFKFFFTGGYQSDQGEELSSRSVKEKIRDLVLDEDPEKPLSDQKIVELLKEQGLPIARRTVAKYREELGIPASHLRKEFE